MGRGLKLVDLTKDKIRGRRLRQPHRLTTVQVQAVSKQKNVKKYGSNQVVCEDSNEFCVTLIKTAAA